MVNTEGEQMYVYILGDGLNNLKIAEAENLEQYCVRWSTES